MKKLLFMLISLLPGLASAAGPATGGNPTLPDMTKIGAITAKVISVRVDHDGKGQVIFDRNVGGTPADCVITAYQNAFAIDTRQPGGRSALSVALTAKTTGATMTVYGLGTCSIYGNWIEDWNHGFLQ